MDLSKLTHPEMVALVEKSEDKEELRAVASYLELSFSGNTGVNTLKEKILSHLNDDTSDASDDTDESGETSGSGPNLEELLALSNSEDEEEIEIAKKPTSAQVELEKLLEMNPAEVEDTALRRKVVRAQSLRLVRCRVRNLDPNESHLEGSFFTAYNKYCGKQTKYVPFSEEANEAGWHIPKMILDHLQDQTYNQRKEVRTRGQASIFGVKTYKTVKVRKFAIEILPPLTREELDELAKRQAAAHSIDRS
jgi:hypothetical protein